MSTKKETGYRLTRSRYVSHNARNFYIKISEQETDGEVHSMWPLAVSVGNGDNKVSTLGLSKRDTIKLIQILATKLNKLGEIA